MSNTLFAFILTFLAGFSTMIGVIAIFIKKDNHDKIVLSALSFAAGPFRWLLPTDRGFAKHRTAPDA